MSVSAAASLNLDGSAAAQPLDFTRQSRFSDPGRHAALFDALPYDPPGAARVVQGLFVYEHVAEAWYDVPLDETRRGESHIRTVEEIIDVLLALDAAPLSMPRPPRCRVVGICRHYMLLSVAILRHHGVPARGRGGFGGYFSPETWEDHWVCEYWNAEEGRWALLDAQFDALWIERFHLDHDITDVPRDRFLAAADAWRKCRSGELDPARFGIEFSKLRGLWFVAGSLIRDAATLLGHEILPWDVWGAQLLAPRELSDDELAFFDDLALLTADPDANIGALRARFAADPRLAVPDLVFNALRQRPERLPKA
ncbi:MAG: transglutaminase domain-containing protein [Rhizobiaceae bacterium]|nr:transglutaminase domain-containing protein [Rhizobiaceae bacterium]MCV0405328.1 transglutaminase domain-containing protein [Rhizobiaceae bacterium]